jgi:hypothetical protein
MSLIVYKKPCVPCVSDDSCEESKDEYDYLRCVQSRQRLIPTDLYPQIFAYFDAKDLANAATVNQYWHVLSLQDHYWGSVCLQTLHLRADNFDPLPSSR